MEARSVTVPSRVDGRISINIIPGHFVTSHSHINYYIDLSKIKHRHDIARLAATALADHYIGKAAVDTIVCMEGTESICAYLAALLADNAGKTEGQSGEISIVTPEYNTSGQMIFRDNLQRMIWGKKILLVLASVTTGKTVNRALECVRYYGGEVVEISALFSAIPSLHDIPVSALFTHEEIPDYRTYALHECPACREQKKIDAMVNSYGYSKVF